MYIDMFIQPFEWKRDVSDKFMIDKHLASIIYNPLNDARSINDDGDKNIDDVIIAGEINDKRKGHATTENIFMIDNLF